MIKANLILGLYLLCLFIPYEGAFQYISHLLLIVSVISFHRYYRLKPILLLYLYGLMVISMQYLFLNSAVYISSYFLSLLYAPLLTLVIPQREMLQYSFNLEKTVRILFLAYALLLWYQAFANWWTPESVGGVHGIIKGPHLNAQLYLLLSGFYLFREEERSNLYSILFLITAIFCGYNMATLIFFLTVAGVFTLNLKIDKKYFKQFAIGGILIGVGIYLLVKISQERNYLFTVLLALSSDLGYSGKIMYGVTFFTEYIQENFTSFLLGASPGNGGSRAALQLTNNYLSVQIPEILISESFFVSTYVYPFLYGVSDITRGTINQPFSSLIALLSEYGLFVGTGFLLYLRNRYKAIAVQNSNAHTFIGLNFFIWLLFSHSMELLPYIFLVHILILINARQI